MPPRRGAGLEDVTSGHQASQAAPPQTNGLLWLDYHTADWVLIPETEVSALKSQSDPQVPAASPAECLQRITIEPLFHQQITAERTRRLLLALALGTEAQFIDEGEIALLNQMIEAGETIIRIKRHRIRATHDTILFWETALQQVLKGALDYIHYRSYAIRRHFSTKNVEILYNRSGHPFFQKHRKQQRRLMEAFFENDKVKFAIKWIEKLAPSITSQGQTINDVLFGKHKSSFEEAYANFRPPLFIDEILTALSCLAKLADQNPKGTPREIQWQLGSHNTQLQTTLFKFQNQINFQLIERYLRALDALEQMVDTTPRSPWSTERSNAWTSQFFGLYAIASHFVSYDHIDVATGCFKDQVKIATDKAKPLLERIDALRTIKHAAVNWLRLKQLALLKFRAGQHKRDFDNIILETLKPLILTELRQSTIPAMRALIAFEIKVTQQKLSHDHLNAESITYPPATPTLNLLGSYAYDLAHLEDLVNLAGKVQTTTRLSIEGILRLLTILGENLKNLSPQMRKHLVGPLADKLIDIRDNVHHSYHHFKKTVGALQDTPGLIEDIIRDIQTIGRHAQKILSGMPQTWPEIETLYKDVFGVSPNLYQFNALTTIVQRTCLKMPIDDYKTLRATGASQVTKAMHETFVEAVIQSISSPQAAATSGVADFKKSLDGLLRLPSKKRKEIDEFYKNLRGLHKGQKAESIKDENKRVAWIKALVGPELIPLDFAANGQSTDDLIIQLIDDIQENIPDEKTLSAKLGGLGIFDQTPWEHVRLELQKSNTAHSVWKNSETFKERKEGKKRQQHTFGEFIDTLKKALNATGALLSHLEKLQQLRPDPDDSNARERAFKDPNITLSIEHHLELIRTEARTITDAVRHMIRHTTNEPYAKELNELYRIISLKLHAITLKGNSIAHLHHVADISGITEYGRQLLQFFDVTNYVDGLAYGGRDDVFTERLSSLINELKSLITPLRKLYKDSSTSIVNAVSVANAPYQTHFKGVPIAFIERPVPPDGNCGWTALGLTRSKSIERLIGAILNNEMGSDRDGNPMSFAQIVHDDIFEAFTIGNLPPMLMLQLQQLSGYIHAEEQAANNLQIEISHLEELEEQGKLTEDQKAHFQYLKNERAKAKATIKDLEDKVKTHTTTPDFIAEFLHAEFLDSHEYLSYVGAGNYGTLYALAQLHNLEVHVWTMQGGQLMETFSVPTAHPANIIHLHHTAYGHELNHFNLLEVVPAIPTPHPTHSITTAAPSTQSQQQQHFEAQEQAAYKSGQGFPVQNITPQQMIENYGNQGTTLSPQQEEWKRKVLTAIQAQIVASQSATLSHLITVEYPVLIKGELRTRTITLPSHRALTRPSYALLEGDAYTFQYEEPTAFDIERAGKITLSVNDWDPIPVYRRKCKPTLLSFTPQDKGNQNRGNPPGPGPDRGAAKPYSSTALPTNSVTQGTSPSPGTGGGQTEAHEDPGSPDQEQGNIYQHANDFEKKSGRDLSSHNGPSFFSNALYYAGRALKSMVTVLPFQKHSFKRFNGR